MAPGAMAGRLARRAFLARAGTARQEGGEDFALLCRARLRDVRPVREPLVLISQIQRSGGTLLSQLFDDHPQVHAHPPELKIGYPKESIWPRLDLRGSTAEWFTTLYERPVRKAFEHGYQKISAQLRRELPASELDSFPFLLPPVLQRRIFDQAVGTATPRRSRDVLDAYMTSYFNAWLDNHNLYTGPKKIVTGFVPRLIVKPHSVAGFFAAYPDGKLLTIVRNPHGWLTSARRHKPHLYGDVGTAVDLWLRSAQAAVDAKRRYGDHVFVLAFEELVEDTEDVLQRLAAYLGIDFRPGLLTPTFNGIPIRANSSFRVRGHGIVRDPVDRPPTLSAAESAFVDERTHSTYQRTLAARG